MKKKRSLFVILLIVLVILCLYIFRIYRASQRYEIVTAAQEYTNLEGVSITIEDPACSQMRYRLTGELLTYRIANDTELDLSADPPPPTRIEKLLPDGSWVYRQWLDGDGNPLIPSAVADFWYAKSTTEDIVVSQKNIFTRWAMEKGTYRLAVDYSCGTGADHTYYTVYAEFTVS